jgi:predicted transcriptional regulator
MEIHFAPDLEAKLNDLASGSGCGPEQLVQELVKSYLDHDQWFRKEVQKGLEQLNRGEFVEHDDVVARIEGLFRS